MTKAVTLPMPIPPLPQDQEAKAKPAAVPLTSAPMSAIVAVATIGNDMYAFSSTGNVWHVTANPFTVTQLFANA